MGRTAPGPALPLSVNDLNFSLTLATGTFAMQTTWANDGSGGSGACEAGHPVVTNGPGTSGTTVTVSNPGNQSTKRNTSVSLLISASDPALLQTLTYKATGQPAGLSINATTGLISGTPTKVQTKTATVTATDTTGAAGSATFTWSVRR